jgi:hypothetical protein
MDIEHLADFLLNLSALVVSEGIISISTRPSSAANRYHATVLPIETWIELLALAGFSATTHPATQALSVTYPFAGADANIIAAAHWQRLNPFRDSEASHQHYVHLVRTSDQTPNAGEFRHLVTDMLDLSYREDKRDTVLGVDLPVVNYHVNFIQDWYFARALMDVWPRGRLRVTLRQDLIAPPYLYMVRGILERTGCPHAVVGTVAEAMQAFETWGGLKGSLVVTATEGLPWMVHQLNSLLVLEARKRGAQTLCLQHGMTIYRSFSPAAAIVGAWDEKTATALRRHATETTHFQVMCTGSPKFLDALLPRSAGALIRRFGPSTKNFRRSVLVGLNLHWQVHSYGPQETYEWLGRLCAANPDTLFILRPHPLDHTIFERMDLLNHPNLRLADELTLLSMDWPVARLVNAVDGVISTYSTMVLDAMAAGRPVVLLPSSESLAADTRQAIPASVPANGGIDSVTVLDQADWDTGRLPEALMRAPNPMDFDSDWFAPSLKSLASIAAAGTAPPTDIGDTAGLIAKSFAKAAMDLCLDRNPEDTRRQVTETLARFLA